MGLFMFPLLPLIWLLGLIGLEAPAGAIADGIMGIIMTLARLIGWGL